MHKELCISSCENLQLYQGKEVRKREQVPQWSGQGRVAGTPKFAGCQGVSPNTSSPWQAPRVILHTNQVLNKCLSTLLKILFLLNCVWSDLPCTVKEFFKQKCGVKRHRLTLCWSRVPHPRLGPRPSPTPSPSPSKAGFTRSSFSVRYGKPQSSPCTVLSMLAVYFILASCFRDAVS